MTESGYIFNDSLEIKVDGFLAYKLMFSDAETNQRNSEFIILLLNEYIYLVSYISHLDYNSKVKDSFLNSLRINTSKKPTQLLGNGSGFKFGYVLGKIAIFGGLGVLIIWLLRRGRKT
jgi:hypothetical protein